MSQAIWRVRSSGKRPKDPNDLGITLPACSQISTTGDGPFSLKTTTGSPSSGRSSPLMEIDLPFPLQQSFQIALSLSNSLQGPCMTSRGQAKSQTIAERIRLASTRLTPAEHKLANALLASYPVAGLSSITEFARAAKVSTPTALRLAKKLGFTGFPSFQAALRGEVSAQLQDPIARHQRWSHDAPDGHVLNRFADAVMENLRGSLKLVDHRSFDRIADLIADHHQAVHIVGGRITMPLAEYFHTHLHMIRPQVTLMPASPAAWPQYLLNMKRGDVLIAFDVRRYDA